MHKSTKEYIKRCLVDKINQCDITLEDLQECLNELKENENNK